MLGACDLYFLWRTPHGKPCEGWIHGRGGECEKLGGELDGFRVILSVMSVCGFGCFSVLSLGTVELHRHPEHFDLDAAKRPPE